MTLPAPQRPSVPPLQWVRPPQQARSQETLQRLLDAAERLAVVHGMSGVTVGDVVREAHSSVGAFYARFTDKDALFRTLHQRACEEAVATADLVLDPVRWRDDALVDAIEQIAAFVVEVFHERSGLVIASSAAVATDSSYAARAADLGRELAARMRRLLEERRAEIDHPDLEVAADFVVRMMLATLEQNTILARVTPTERTISRSELARQLARAMLGYLGAARKRSHLRPARGARP